MKKDEIKILVAEDDPFLGKIISGHLKESGLQLDHAKDGSEALELLNKNKYDLVLLDLVMPKKSGFDVLEELQKKKSKTPVLVFTNLSQEEDEKRVKELGAKGFYVKHDVSIGDLMDVIKKYI